MEYNIKFDSPQPQLFSEFKTGLPWFHTFPARPKPAKATKQKSTKKNTPSSSAGYVNVDLRSKDNNPVVCIEQDVNTTTKTTSKVARTQSTETEAEEEVEEAEVEGAVDAVAAHQSVYYNDDVYMTSEGARLKLDSIQQHLLNKLRGDDMAKEFKVGFFHMLYACCPYSWNDFNTWKNVNVLSVKCDPKRRSTTRPLDNHHHHHHHHHHLNKYSLTFSADCFSSTLLKIDVWKSQKRGCVRCMPFCVMQPVSVTSWANPACVAQLFIAS